MEQELSQSQIAAPEKVGAMPVEAWLRLLGEGAEEDDADPRQNGAVGVFQMVGSSAVIRRVLLPLDTTGARSRGCAAKFEELRRDVITLGADGQPVRCSCSLFREQGSCRHLDEVRRRITVLMEARRPGRRDTTNPDALEVLIGALQAPREDPRGRPASVYMGGYQPKGLWADSYLESALLQVPKTGGLVNGGISTYESRLAASLDAVFSDTALNPLRVRILILAGMEPAQIEAAGRTPQAWLRWARAWASGRPKAVLTAFRPAATREELEVAIEALEQSYRAIDGPVEEGTLPVPETHME